MTWSTILIYSWYLILSESVEGYKPEGKITANIYLATKSLQWFLPKIPKDCVKAQNFDIWNLV